MSAPGLERSARVYRRLLGIYPSSFRERYADDAVELFRDGYRAAWEARGRFGCAVHLLRTFPNALLHGVLERVTQLGRQPDPHGQASAASARAPGFTGRGEPHALVASAFRSLGRNIGLTVTMVSTLGVAIGAVVALFAVVRGVLLTPLPFPEADRLIRMWETNPEVDGSLQGVSPLNAVDWQRAETGIESMATWYLTSETYRGEFGAEEVRSAQVTGAFFDVLGVEAAIGRTFQAGDVVDYGPVVLSDGLWRRLFGADAGVVGRTVTAGERSYEIVGVMPADFSFPDESVEVWTAWDLQVAYEGRPETRTWRFLDGIGRLGPGTGLERAEEQLAAVAATLAERHPAENRGWTVALSSLHDDVVGGARGPLWLALAGVTFILLIAWANVASLILARVPTRSRELAIRSALGAGRARLVRELLAEHLAISLLAGGVGLAVAIVMLDGLVALDAGRIPRLAEVRIDPGVLLFATGLSLLTGLVSGLLPAVQSLTRAAAPILRQGNRGSTPTGQNRIREVFVCAQVAITVVLLFGAGLFQTSLTRLLSQDPGLDPTAVATFRVSLDPADDGVAATRAYYDGLLGRLEDLPGVLAVGAAQTLPFSPVANDFRRPYRATGSELASADAPAVQMRIVTPGYVEAIGMRLLAGEAIPASVEPDGPLVALINETLARELWPGGDAVGETLELDFRDGWREYRVLGVAQDVKHYGLREPSRPEIYLAHPQVPYLAMTVVARTVGDPEAMFEPLRAAVLGHLPIQPPHDFVALSELTRASVAEDRFLSVLLRVLGAVALLLAVTGVYGVIAYAVSHRRAEIGVRMALGARPASVVGSVLGRAVTLALAGLLVGLTMAVLLASLVESLLYGVSPHDPRIAALVSLGLLAVATLAAYLPARRAAGIAPTEALRES